MPRLPHQTTLLAALLAGALTLGACAGEAPLDGSLTEPQQEALATSWSQRIEVVAAPALDPEKIAARARGLNEACRALDTEQPFLAAVKATCGPTAVHAKLGAVLPERCVTPAAICVRAVERIKGANDQVIEALKSLTVAAQQVTDDPACRAEFVTTAAQLEGYQERSRAYGILALGAARKDPEIMQLGRNRIADAGVMLARSGDARQQRQAFLDACQLDPPGT